MIFVRHLNYTGSQPSSLSQNSDGDWGFPPYFCSVSGKLQWGHGSAGLLAPEDQHDRDLR